MGTSLGVLPFRHPNPLALVAFLPVPHHLASILPVLLHHVRLLAAPPRPAPTPSSPLPRPAPHLCPQYTHLPHLSPGFTDIQDFRIANAFCHSIPEHKIQRDLIC